MKIRTANKIYKLYCITGVKRWRYDSILKSVTVIFKNDKVLSKKWFNDINKNDEL